MYSGSSKESVDSVTAVLKLSVIIDATITLWAKDIL